MTTKTTLI